MPHHTPLIATIVVGIVLAFALGALANRLRISPIVGYLLAGVLVGPHTPGFVADQELATLKSTGVTYWEGSCRVEGTRRGRPIGHEEAGLVTARFEGPGSGSGAVGGDRVASAGGQRISQVHAGRKRGPGRLRGFGRWPGPWWAAGGG